MSLEKEVHGLSGRQKLKSEQVVVRLRWVVYLGPLLCSAGKKKVLPCACTVFDDINNYYAQV